MSKVQRFIRRVKAVPATLRLRNLGRDLKLRLRYGVWPVR